MKKKFTSGKLREEIYDLKEFNDIGGADLGLSLPLIAEIDGKCYVVFMVFTVSDEIPGAFVLCMDGKDPEYLDYEEGLDRLGISEDYLNLSDISYDGSDAFSGDPDGGEDIDMDTVPSVVAEIPTDIFERFDKAYGDGTIDRDAYLEYLDTVMSVSPPELRRYIAFFLI